MNSNPSFAYRQSSAAGANPVRMVILLYEQLINDIQRAVVALEADRIEERTKGIDHALIVVGHLQAALDMDRGGEVAHNLDHFYNLLRRDLIEAQVRRSAQRLNDQVGYLLEMRQAWIEIEHRMAQQPDAQAPDRQTVVSAASPDTRHANWRA